MKSENGILYPSRIKNGNIGDLFINVVLLTELIKNNKVYIDGENDNIIKYISTTDKFATNVKVLNKLGKLGHLPVIRWIFILPYLSKIHYFFDPPGGYSDNGDLKNTLKFFKYFGRTYFIKLLGKKNIRIGISLVATNKRGWQNQKKLSSQYEILGIRDNNNYNELTAKKFNNLYKVEDLAFLYSKDDFLLKDSTYTGIDYIVLSFRGSTVGDTTDSTYLNNLIASILQNVFFFQRRIVISYQVQEDFFVCEKIFEILKKQGVECDLINEMLMIEDAMVLYRNAAFVFTNRLHVALFAVLNDTVPIVITDLENHGKIVNLMQELGLRKNCYDFYSNIDININKQLEVEVIHNIDIKRKKLKEFLKYFS